MWSNSLNFWFNLKTHIFTNFLSNPILKIVLVTIKDFIFQLSGQNEKSLSPDIASEVILACQFETPTISVRK